MCWIRLLFPRKRRFEKLTEVHHVQEKIDEKYFAFSKSICSGKKNFNHRAVQLHLLLNLSSILKFNILMSLHLRFIFHLHANTNWCHFSYFSIWRQLQHCRSAHASWSEDSGFLSLRVLGLHVSFWHYGTKLTPAISDGTFLVSPAGAGVQGGSAPLLGSWDTT